MDMTGFVVPHAGAALLVLACLLWAKLLSNAVCGIWHGRGGSR